MQVGFESIAQALLVSLCCPAVNLTSSNRPLAPASPRRAEHLCGTTVMCRWGKVSKARQGKARPGLGCEILV